MIHKIVVREKTKTADILFCREFDLDALPNPRIVPLFGANGAGKTTLLKAIENTPKRLQMIKFLKEQRDSADTASSDDPKWTRQYWEREIIAEQNRLLLDIDQDSIDEIILEYRNSDDNFRNRQARTLEESFNPILLGSKFDAKSLSEGQSIMYSSLFLFDALKPGSTDIIKEGQSAIVLIDELDSGLSLDNLDSVLRKIRTIVRNRNDVQLFLSFNTSYVLKYFPDVISLYDGKVHHLKNESEMLEELRKNKKMLNKARKMSNGQYRIFD